MYENNRKSSYLVGRCKALESSGQGLNPVSILTKIIQLIIILVIKIIMI